MNRNTDDFFAYIDALETRIEIVERNQPTAAAGAGSGDMVKSTYDPANVNQQLVGTTATQTVANKTLTGTKSITFDMTSDVDANQGQMKWDLDQESFVFGVDSGSIPLGSPHHIVRNATGATIARGSFVYASGTIGTSGRITVAKYPNNHTIDPTYTLGFMLDDTPNGEDGICVAAGKIVKMNTSAWAEGTTLYPSTSNPGWYQDTKPTAPNAKAAIAFVITSHATNGVLAVRHTTPTSIADDNLAELSTLANGDLLAYNSTTSRFENRKIAYAEVTGLTAALDAKLNTSLKGAANGLAELDATGKVPAAQLPSYVDDVLEYANLAAFPGTGETGKIYTALDTNVVYRWSGTVYVEISSSLALGETSTTAYRGDRGKTAYDHSQDVTTNPHAVTKAQVGLGNVDNTSDATKNAATATLTNKTISGASNTLTNIPNSALTTNPLERANHTGTQLASTISDLPETIEDTIGSKIVAGTGIGVVYSDTTGETTVSYTGGGGGGLTAAQIVDLVYPVGTIYENGAVVTNPATLIGYGTWVAYGAGRVSVPIDVSQTEFDTLGETGGEKAHILTTGEMPGHTHANTPPAATTSTYTGTGTATWHGAGSATNLAAVTGVMTSIGARSPYRTGGNNTGTAGSQDGFSLNVTHNHTVTVPAFTSGSTGGGAAHNNLQPYIVCAAWIRTA